MCRGVSEPAAWPRRVCDAGSNEESYQINKTGKIVREKFDRAFEMTYLRDKQPGLFLLRELRPA